MKRLFLFIALLTALPAHADRSDFGHGVAAMACAMLDAGYSQREAEEVLQLLGRQIVRSGISERSQSQMASGFNYMARKNNCPLRGNN
tara:strand:- start:918 stop:1181 length:264 start_codon:yes stop_codon:yes gene_type:complete